MAKDIVRRLTQGYYLIKQSPSPGYWPPPRKCEVFTFFTSNYQVEATSCKLSFNFYIILTVHGFLLSECLDNGLMSPVMAIK